MKPLIPVVAITLAAAACSRAPVVNTAEVRAVRSPAELPALDPQSKLWDPVPEHPAILMVQDVAEPRLTTPGVDLVKVRAMHNGTTIVFRLEWADATQDLVADVGRGTDAAAIQLPLQPGADVPDPAMGQLGKGVQIAYWKAAWQDDADRAPSGKDRVASLHPNAIVDHYPSQAGNEARAEMERRYAPAQAAGNPILTARNGAVQEMTVEGFGNATVPAAQRATGRGHWSAGRWMTTIARPLTEGAGAANLQAGQKTYAAFAVWDGAQRHTGARKMRSGWIPLVLE